MNAIKPVRVAIYDRSAGGSCVGRTGSPLRTAAADARHSVVATYFDDHVSGLTDLSDRVGGQQLLNDAGAGKFDEVRVADLARLGRDMKKVQRTLACFAEAGVAVVIASSGSSMGYQAESLR